MPVWKSILSALLTVLLTLMACSDPTPAPTNTPAPTQAPAPTPRSTATPTPAPTEPSYAPGDEPGQGAIIPLMLDDSETFASEVSDSELACMAGTADIAGDGGASLSTQAWATDGEFAASTIPSDRIRWFDARNSMKSSPSRQPTAPGHPGL